MVDPAKYEMTLDGRVYFNNNGEGLNFLDILSFHQTDGPFLYKVKLNDTHIQNIHVGVIAPV